MHTPDHPREIIERLRLERGIVSHRALALAAEIQQPTLARYMNGTSETMEMASFVKLARALDVTVSELLGEVPLHGGHRVRELTAIYNVLPEPQQAALLAAGQAMARASGVDLPAD